MTKMIRICLWSGPRNISTALMYSFAQRTDMSVVDEPLYAHYLSKTAAFDYHPGSEAVLASQENDGEKVVQDIILGDYPTTAVFHKNMTHHLQQLDWAFLSQTVNVLLTRDPVDMLPSYAKQVPNPQLHDTGYADHLKLYTYLKSLGQEPPILEAKQVLLNPRSVLGQLCEAIGIEFQERMLQWEKGARPEDGVWAKYWYDSVHRSTGFRPFQPKDKPFPERLQPLLEACQPLYGQLADLAIRP